MAISSYSRFFQSAGRLQITLTGLRVHFAYVGMSSLRLSTLNDIQGQSRSSHALLEYFRDTEERLFGQGFPWLSTCGPVLHGVEVSGLNWLAHDKSFAVTNISLGPSRIVHPGHPTIRVSPGFRVGISPDFQRVSGSSWSFYLLRFMANPLRNQLPRMEFHPWMRRLYGSGTLHSYDGPSVCHCWILFLKCLATIYRPCQGRM